MNEEFKKRIINDFGLSKMDAETQEKMIERIGNLLFESVIERSIDLLDKDGLSQFDLLIGKTAGGDYPKVINFLKDKVPGFKEIVSQELAHIKRTTSGVFS